mmetsp:Transcript_8421/g.11068  ORF Transcript_8421/g.11068 Transcript_8421/m.11068 type:complete len:202 (+) Transcript_8421:113-718(+)
MHAVHFLAFVAIFTLVDVTECFVARIPTSLPNRRGSLQSLSSSGEKNDQVSQLPLLEAELASCQEMEKREELQGQIDDAKISAEFGIRRVQSTFYDAFSNQDLTAMAEIWSTSQDVRCVHPGMPSLMGNELIMQSWEQIFSPGQAFTIQPSLSKIDICGQTALCSCVEETPGGGKLECLNVYRREDGAWKMILHMASPIAF